MSYAAAQQITPRGW